MNKTFAFVCSLCGERYLGWGHNAAPLNDGRCCDECNAFRVVPERVRRLQANVIARQKEEQPDKGLVEEF